MKRQRQGSHIMYGKKTMQTKEVYSQFVPIHCPGFFVTISKNSHHRRSYCIYFCHCFRSWYYSIVTWTDSASLSFQVFVVISKQRSSSLDNNLIVLPLELSNRNENGYNTLSGTWKSSTFWCRDFTFSKTVLVRFVKKALIWSNEWRV